MSSQNQNQNESTNNQQIQGVPQIQPQGIPNQMQGIPQLQQQQQQQQQVQGYPIQGYDTNSITNNSGSKNYKAMNMNMNNIMNNKNMNMNMNNNFYPMQQQQQMPYPSQSYSAQGLNAQISTGSSIASGSGFRLVKFAETNTNKKDLETVSEGKENDNDKDKPTKLKLAAVIVTICDGSTYDSLFSTVKQDAGEGSRVAVYACQKNNIKDLMNAIKAHGDINISDRKDDLQLLLNDLNEIEDESCVAINYECCSECSDNGFHGMNSQQIMDELQFFLKQGYLIMYSDFSLKAFIKAWNDLGQKTSLGANPLVRTNTFTGSVTLNFNPYTLKTCISSQLQSVGELCPDQDFCTVHCMGNTVRYSIKKKYQKNCDNLPYDIEMLTIAQFGKSTDSCSIQVPDFSMLKKNKKKSKDKKEKRDSGGFLSMFGFGKKKDTKSDEVTKKDIIIKDETKDEKKEENEKKKDENDKELEKDIDVTKLAMKTLWGDAGHVVLDFSKQRKDENEKDKKDAKETKGSGDVLYGKILLSMTHWCELVKLGDQINDDVLFKVAAKNMGTSSKAYQEMQTTYESFGGKNASGQQYVQQQAWVSKTANQMVQQQAPCNNMMNSNISYSKGGYY